MILSEVQKALENLSQIQFILPNGQIVSNHFHVTEIGEVTKKFIDCGGTIRQEAVVNFQLWEADDYDHRLAPQKLMNIINLSIDKLGLQDLEIEVEYQSDTISKYGLSFDGISFILTQKFTDCLAPDKCGVPIEKQKLKLSEINASSCTPSSGCC